jgi:hypothetical protein
MTRKNEDRFGISDPNTAADASAIAASAPIPSPTQQESPLSFVAPTEFVELPSRGKFYAEDHPLYNKTIIEIKQMTTKEEDILTSQELLRQGKAMDRFVKQIILDKTIDPDTLLIGDKNAVLIAARRSGYGADYKTKVICPSCQQQSTYQFDLNSASYTDGIEESEGEENVSIAESGNYLIKLPVSGWSVEVKQLNGKDEKEIMETAEKRKKRKLPEDTLTTQMKLFIVSIQGITDRPKINEAVSIMLARDSRALRDAYKRITPNIDLTQDFACSECSYSGDMEVPFTTDFFWPKQ